MLYINKMDVFPFLFSNQIFPLIFTIQTQTNMSKTKSAPATNLFATKGSAPATKKSDKKIILIKDPPLEKSINKFALLRELSDIIKAELSGAEAQISEIATATFVKEYKTLGKNPGSFILSTPGAARVMSIHMDKYPKIDEDRYKELRDRYKGFNVVTETTTYSFNNEILSPRENDPAHNKRIEKFTQELSDFIMKSKTLTDEEKASIITPSTTYAIRKGLIDDLHTLNVPIEQAMADFMPVTQLKSPAMSPGANKSKILDSTPIADYFEK